MKLLISARDIEESAFWNSEWSIAIDMYAGYSLNDA